MWQNKLKSVRSVFLVLMAILLVAGVAAGCGKKKEEPGAAAPAGQGKPEDVLVTYKGGGKVTRGEFDTYIKLNTFFNKQYEQFKADPTFQQEMMKQYVTFKVLASRADDKAKAEADKQFKQQFEMVKTQLNAAEGGIDKQLKDAGLTQAQLEDFIKSSILTITAAESQVSDADVKKAYDERVAQDKNAFDTASVRHILIGTQDPNKPRTKEEALKLAKEVQEKLKQGGDFAALAKEFSDDGGSKENGGLYADALVSQWVPQFKKAALELPLNQISDPVETDYGYHVMKVEARKTKTFEEAAPELRSAAAESKVYEFIEKELPTTIETNNLPKPEEKKPAETPAPATEAPKTDAPKTDAPKTETGK